MQSGRKSATRDEWKRGYRDGYSRGVHLACCEAVARRLPPASAVQRDLKVLYIPQGFAAIDRGVIEGLRETVRQPIVGDARDMLRLAETARPDLVLVLNGLHTFPADHASQIDRIRALGIKTAVWFVDDPYFTDDSAKVATHYDHVFTHELSCVPFYKNIGCPDVRYLPLAVSTTLYRPLAVDSRYCSDICFIGVGFPNRVRLFNRLVPYFSRKRVVIIGPLWNRLQGYRSIAGRVHLQRVSEEESVKYYNGASVVINLHRAPDDPKYNRNSRNIPALSINPRTYEIAACGAFQLTDVREDLPSFYTPGYDIATYESADDLLGRLEHYLRHEDERRRIALRGLSRTIREHTFPNRLRWLLDAVFGPADANQNAENAKEG